MSSDHLNDLEAIYFIAIAQNINHLLCYYNMLNTVPDKRSLYSDQGILTVKEMWHLQVNLVINGSLFQHNF